MPDPAAVVGALNTAASAVDKLVSISRDCVATQRKLALYPNQLADFKFKAHAVKKVLEETPPGPEGSVLHTARSELSNAVDAGLVCTSSLNAEMEMSCNNTGKHQGVLSTGRGFLIAWR